MSRCELCQDAGGVPVHRDLRWRVVRVADPDFPAYYRVIWNAHAAEFTDLAPAERQECIDIVARVERVLRDALAPAKINLASLGNQVPHLHWHVIARFASDSRFPDPVWAPPRRDVPPPPLAVSLEELDRAVAAAMPPRSAGD